MSGMQKKQQQQAVKSAAKAKKQNQKSNPQVNARQMLEAPETLRSEEVLAAQQQVGNHVVQRALSPGARDAAVTDEQGNLLPELSSTIQQKRGGGAPLPDAVRKDARKALGKEFKNVRVHSDDTSDKLSRKISARAFTIGSDIFFKRGVFAPSTSKGRETLMHELTHVVQQSGSRSTGGKLKLGAPGTASEKEADRAGKKHSQAAAGLATSVSGIVQKQGSLEDEELIQGQPEMEEEELIQGQAEEEELQMQPDTGNVVQRTEDDDDGVGTTSLNYKKYAKSIGSGKIGSGIKSRVSMFEEMAKPQKLAPLAGKGGQRVAKGISGQVKKFGGSNKPIEGDTGKPVPIPRIKRTPPPLPTGPKPKIPKRGTQTPNKPLPKQSNVIPKAPELPKPKAKQEGPLSFSDQIKAKSKSMRSNSQRENLANLEQDRMQKTGARVSEQYMEDQANKPKSKWQKFKGFAKKAGSKSLSFGKLAGMAAIGKVGSALKSNLTQAKEQFFGKSKEKKEAPTPAPSPVTINNIGGGGSGGGNGGGGGGMAETISDLFQENKKLKSQIAELEKEKEKV